MSDASKREMLADVLVELAAVKLERDRLRVGLREACAMVRQPSYLNRSEERRLVELELIAKGGAP